MMVKTVVGLTRPTPACRDTPLRGTAAARFATRRLTSVMSAHGRETVSAQWRVRLVNAAEIAR